MARGLGLIGPTVLMALIGLPIVALAGLWWRLFPPDRHRERAQAPVPVAVPVRTVPAVEG